MRHPTTILFFFLLPTMLFATGQASDLLVKDGDTLTLFTKPLYTLLHKDSLWYKTDNQAEFNKVLECWTGYTAVWVLEEKELYLTEVRTCTKSGTKFKADLSTLFGPKYKDGKVRADWVNGELLIPIGDMLRYFEMYSMSYYEGELILTMQDGVLVNEEPFDNSKTYQSRFTKDSRTLPTYLYSHIDWSKIPDLGDKKVKVFLEITPGKNPQDFSVDFMKKSYYYTLDQEALRVVKSLPEWDVYYRRGKVHPVPWYLPVTFDEVTRQQYGK